jgi:hypothetical protein
MGVKISYAITCCNEEETINLVKFLHKNKRDEDEICVLLDKPKCNEFLLNALYKFSSSDWITLKESKFNGDFSDWKNELNNICKGDFIVNLDADEMITSHFMDFLPLIIENNPEVDFYWVPRENYVTGITQEHIQKWGWKLDSQNRINYPDIQGRIYKNEPNRIMWVNKVHEKITGYKHFSTLPDNPIFSINHTKTIEKQEKQNNYYNTL